MRYFILLLLVLTTSCGGYIDSLNAYRNSPQGREQLRRQFTLDSIRASRTIYPFRYNYNYYWNNQFYPRYYRYYRPNRGIIIQRDGFNRTRITVPRNRTRTRVDRPTPRTRPNYRPSSNGRRNRHQ